MIVFFSLVAVGLIVILVDRDESRPEIVPQYAPGPVDSDAPTEFTTTESGARYRIVRKATGNYPNSSSKLRLHYIGRLKSGQVFESTYDSGLPQVLQLNGTIKGWQESVIHLGEGGMMEIEVPAELGYGSEGTTTIPPNSDLFFTVELVEIL